MGSSYAVLPTGEPSPQQKRLLEAARARLAEGETPLADIAAAERLNPEAALDLAHHLEAVGEAVFIGETHLWPTGRYEELRRTAVSMLKEAGSLRVIVYKERAGLSRKTATLLLDHFHERGLTKRESGTHVLDDEDAARPSPLV